MDSPTLRRPAPPPGFSYDDAEPAAAPASAAPTSIERPAPPPGFSYEAADAPAPKLQRPGRSFARAAGDLGVGLLEGTVSAGMAIPQLANTLTGGAVDRYLFKPATAAVDRALGGHGVGSTLAEASQDTRDALDTLKSDDLRQREQELADTKGFLPSLKRIVTDPTLLAQQVAEQVPQFVTPAGVTRKAGEIALERAAGAALARGTAKRVAAGMTEDAAREAALPAAQRLGQRAAIKAGTAAAIGSEAAVSASQNSEQAQQEVMGMDQSVLDANPDYQAMVAQGATPQDAREALAQQAGRRAAAVAGALTAATGGLTGKLESRIFQGEVGHAAPLLSRPGAKELGKAVAKEFTQEALQEGGEQFGQNVGVQSVDPNKDLMDQVPEQAALGGVIGGVSGGGLYAGSAAMRTRLQHPRFAGAAPGSLSDAANTIDATAGPISRAAAAAPTTQQAAAAPRDAEQTPALQAAKAEFDTTMRATANQGVNATRLAQEIAAKHGVSADDILHTPDVAPKPASSTRVDPGAPPWLDPTTGEVQPPTKEKLVAALADHIVRQQQATGDMRISTPAIAQAWGVPKGDVDRARDRAVKAARDQVAAAERAAMGSAGAGAQPDESASQPDKPASSFDKSPSEVDAGGEPDTAASAPVMVTRGMKRELRTLGHTDADIAKMTPQQAHDTLRAGEPVLQGARELAGEQGGPAVDQAVEAQQEQQKAQEDTGEPEADRGTEAAAPAGESAPAGGEAAAQPSEDVAAGRAHGTEEPAPAGGADLAGAGPDSNAQPALSEPAESPPATPAPTTATETPPSGGVSASGGGEPTASDGGPATTERVRSDRPLSPGAAMQLQEAHKALGRGVTRDQVLRMRDRLAEVVESGAERNGGVTVKLRPKALEARRAQLARLDADLSLFDQQTTPAPKPKPHKVSIAARDAEGLRVKTPDGEVNGRAHVDQLVARGFDRVESLPAGDRMVHRLVNAAGDMEPIKARQLKYAQEVTARAPSAQATTSGDTELSRREVPQYNLMRPAEKITSTLYRETNPEGAAELLDGMSGHAGLARNTVYAASHEHLAQGQGNNRGVLMELDPAGFDGRLNLSKPAARQLISSAGQAELEITPKAKSHSGAFIRSVTLKPRWKAGQSAAYANRVLLRLRQLEEKGWTKEKTEAGIVYRPPAMATGKEPLQVADAADQTAPLPLAEKVEAAAAEAASSPANDKPEPTEAQKEAGNYAKGHVSIQGLDISIENPRGSTRSGVGENGKPWSHVMSDHYGYIRRTEGADGDHVDVYVGPNPESQRVFVVDQLDQKTGAFDEHKSLVGFDSEDQAVKAYRSNFDKGWKVGPVHAMGMDEFKTWLKEGDTTRPAGERETSAETEPVPSFRQGASAPSTTPEASADQQAHVAAVRKIADGALSRWKGDDVPGLRVVATPEDLPAIAKRGADGRPDPSYQRARGMYDGRTIWIVASAHQLDPAGRREILTTMAHEGIGHFGVDAIVDRELGAGAWKKIEGSVARLRADKALGSASMRDVLDSVESRYGTDASPTLFARETLAVMAERGVRNGLMDRVVAAVRRWLRHVLPKLKVSESELRQLLVRSRDYLERGPSYAERVRSTQAMAFSRDGWEADFPDAVLAMEHGQLAKHADYAAAKAGDGQAAARVARDAVNPEFVGRVRAALPADTKPIIVPVVAREAAGNNKIPAAAAQVLAQRLGTTADTSIVQAEKVSRGGSDAMHRLANPPAFEGKVEAGRDYVLLDDTLAQGGTMAQLKTHIERGGGRVVLATALTGKDYSRKLALDPGTLGQVRERFGRIEGWWRRHFGYGFDGLTQSEARAILAYDKGRLSPDSLRDRVLAKRIPGLRGVGEAATGDRPGTEAPGAAGREESDFSLSPAGQTDTPAFKRWFGNSKVVDRNGAPRAVYHGTAEDFDAFDPGRSGSATAHMTATLGTFFAEDRSKAQHYAENASQGVPADERIVDAYLSIQRPYVMGLKQFMGIDSQEEATALRKRLASEGYDGIHLKDVGQWVAFRPEQIKSASANRGTFDSGTGNIYFSLDDRGERADPDQPDKPFSRSAQSIHALQEGVPKQQESLLQAAKGWIAGKARDFEPAALGALQLRHVLELMEDSKLFPAAKQYAGYHQQMDADRQAQIDRGSELTQKWQAWAYEKGPAGWMGKLKPEAKQLARFIHDVTQLGIDPTDTYKKLLMTDSRGEHMPWTKELIKERTKALREQMRGRPGDDKSAMIEEIKHLKALPGREKYRESKYPELVARWNALPDKAKDIFRMARDRYQELSDLTERALLDRIEALSVPETYKRSLRDRIRFQFEANRVEGVYFPLSRFGDYWVSGSQRDGQPVFGMFESYREAEQAIQRLKAAGVEIEAQGLKDSDYKAKNAPSGTFVADVIGLLQKSGAPEKVQDEVYQLFLKTLPELSMRKHGIHRKNIAGFSDDALRAFAKNNFHSAHQIARLKHGFQMEAALDAMETAFENQRNTGKLGGNTELDLAQAVHGDALLGELKKRNDWIMSPKDSQMANVATSVGYLYYMSASPAAALVNLTQGAQVTLPVLGARHGWPKAMRALGAATRDALRTGGNIQRVLKTDEERQAFKVLEAQGTFQRTATHTLAGIAEGNALKSNPAWARVMNVMGWLFHKAEVVNREAAGVAAFRLARGEGQTFDQAVRYADEIVNGTHFDYSNANRARYMQGNVPKILFQFKNYSVGMSWVLYRNLYKAVKGESPEVRRLARRTLTGVLGMTGLFAGVMGLPIINLLRYAANAAHAVGGDDDEPWDFNTEFRSWLAEHLGEDVARWVADGAVSQVTGANVASRVSLSDLWFRDPDRELEGRDAYYNYLDAIAGPLGGIAKNMLVGSQMIGQGHVERGVETILPKFIKDAMKSMRYASEGSNTLRGDPIVPDVSTAQTLLQAIGFQPTGLREQQRINSALMNYQHEVQDRRQLLINAFAMAQLAGDDDGRGAALEKIRAFNAKFPEVAIHMGNLQASLRTRVQRSAEAQNGIFLQKRLAGRIRQEVGAMAGG